MAMHVCPWARATRMPASSALLIVFVTPTPHGALGSMRCKHLRASDLALVDKAAASVWVGEFAAELGEKRGYVLVGEDVDRRQVLRAGARRRACADGLESEFGRGRLVGAWGDVHMVRVPGMGTSRRISCRNACRLLAWVVTVCSLWITTSCRCRRVFTSGCGFAYQNEARCAARQPGWQLCHTGHLGGSGGWQSHPCG